MQSVIVSTYNKPHQLRLVLEGLRHQTADAYEVIVADDGSTDDTRDLIAQYQADVPFRVEHVWQDDDGFRAARVRNLGVKAATGSQIIFLDGDCIPFRTFLDAHRDAARAGVVLAGNRLFLDKDPSAALTVEQVTDESFVDEIPRSEFRRLRWQATKDRVYRATRLKERPKVVTANLALDRTTFDAVNGLDERFVGWGHEDEDLRRRLVRRGFRVESVFTRALVCHLWHRQVDSFHGKVKFGDNIPYFKRGFYLSRCRDGLEKIPLDQCTVTWSEPAVPSEVAIAWDSRAAFGQSEVKVLLCCANAGDPHLSRPPEQSAADLHVVVGSRQSTELLARNDGQPPELHLEGQLDPNDPGDRQRLLAQLEPII